MSHLPAGLFHAVASLAAPSWDDEAKPEPYGAAIAGAKENVE